jgi:hypothetical protein
MKKILLALLCCLAVAAIGCTDSTPVSGSPRDEDPTPAPPLPPGPIPFETVYKGCIISMNWSPSPPCWEGLPTYVIENQTDLEALWADYEIPGLAPVVDFDSRTVAAVFGGQMCTECEPDYHDLEIISVAQTESCTSVEIEAATPCSDCDSYPLHERAHIISIPKPDTPICFDGNCTWSEPDCYECCGLPPCPI